MGAGGADPAGTGGTGTGGVGGAGAGSGGDLGVSGMGAAGVGGEPGNGAEDIDMTAEDFSCIADWDKVLGFRITNLLGHLDEALAVAQSATGGTYPPGTVIQHLPTEAMVKRATGFSPETMDWEFFLLSLSPDGVTTISERGTTEIATSMGQTCVSCHSLAAPEFDLVCNTWAEQSGGSCGFDFGDSFLDMQLASVMADGSPIRLFRQAVRRRSSSPTRHRTWSRASCRRRSSTRAPYRETAEIATRVRTWRR
jgi:hypothetical protein